MSYGLQVVRFCVCAEADWTNYLYLAELNKNGFSVVHVCIQVRMCELVTNNHP